MSALLILFFALAALGGIYLISYILTDKNTPKGVALIHGSVALLGIIILIIATFYNHALIYSLIVFLLAACGGLILFIMDLTGKQPPKALALGHGLIAVTGFILLLLAVMHYL